MNALAHTILVGITLWLGQIQPIVGNPQVGIIDSARSTITVRVYKSGFLSAFGHDHEIQAPIESGEVKGDDSPSVELRVAARKLRVIDREASEKTRAQIQETMQGEKVLDVTRFPEIRFQSTRVEAKGLDRWIVRGTLALRGQERPVAVDVTLKGEHHRGSATLKQSDFGITPVTVAGGTVKVKDEVKVEFDIVLRSDRFRGSNSPLL